MALEIIRNPALWKRTTLGLGGEALAEGVARDRGDLGGLSRLLETEGGRPMAIGWGSNLLCGDGLLERVLVRAANDEISVDGTTVRAGAGALLPRLLQRLKDQGLSGLENMTGIPGTIGGAVAMNAGSYGTETRDRLTRVRLWTPKDGLFWKDAAECSMGYRSFDPGLDDEFHLVWEAEFSLSPGDPAAIKEAMDATMQRKKAGQPVGARSAGCVFKNPQGDSAGRLLDLAGFRGRTLGTVGFSEVHANFLVNLAPRGRGRSEDAMELIAAARAEVQERFGIHLDTEVVIP